MSAIPVIISGRDLTMLIREVVTLMAEIMYIIAMRELLLNYAEAQNEAVGPDASVYEAVNAIRQRPGTDLPALDPGMTQAEMRTAIKRERRIELVYEGHRLYDLWRWKDAMVEHEQRSSRNGDQEYCTCR